MTAVQSDPETSESQIKSSINLKKNGFIKHTVMLSQLDFHDADITSLATMYSL